MELKRILILSSLGGNGHVASVEAIQSTLGNRYAYEVIYPFNELRFCGCSHFDHLYNFLLQRGWVRTISFISRWPARLVFRITRRQVRNLLDQYVERFQPDLILSAVPYLNAIGLISAQKRGIPYLLVTLDNDLRHWVPGLDKANKEGLQVTVGVDSPLTRDLLRDKGIPEEAIHTTGLPLRSSFYQPPPTQSNEKRPIVLLMLGGVGAKTTYSYVRRLLRLDLPVDLYVTSGRNQALFQWLMKQPNGEHCHLHAMTIKESIAPIMAQANLLITKPGPLSTSEALALRCPLLLDQTRGILPWERANLEFVEDKGLGVRIRNLNQIESLVPHLLQEETQRRIAKAYDRVAPNSFNEKLRPLVASLTQ